MAYSQQAIVPVRFHHVPTEGLRTTGQLKKRFAQANGVDVASVVVYAVIGDFEYEFADDMLCPQYPRIVLKPIGACHS